MQKGLFHALPKVQFFRYAVVGGLATLLDMGVYAVLTHMGVRHWAALGVSFGVALVVGFGLSRVWAFRAKEGQWYWQFFRFLIVAVVMYFVSGWLMQGLYMIWPPMMWRNFWVRGVAAIGTLPLSYYLSRRFTFRQGPIFSRKSLPLRIG
ncbi:MAG: GtrA family protein [Bacteroidota bacterium]|nr:GtrA family protein [Bacteroidota bacterium]